MASRTRTAAAAAPAPLMEDKTGDRIPDSAPDTPQENPAPEEVRNGEPAQPPQPPTGQGGGSAPATESVTPAQEIPPAAKALLQVFSAYEKLYIDAAGGVYTPATPAPLRSGALLYTNPHYKA